MPTPTKFIRNFSIIAHIDHGKSTLADRLLDATGALSERERKAQFLDSMDLERERGITIKAATVRLDVQGQGRPDLRAEPDRHARARRLPLRGVALAGRLRGRAAGGGRLPGGRGADAWPTCTWPVNNNLAIIPVINKIDLPSADPENVERQIEDVVGIDASEPILASAKDGQRHPARSSRRWSRSVPPPVGRRADSRSRVLLLDSWYDSYRGVVMLVRVVDGALRAEAEDSLDGRRTRLRDVGLGAFAPFPREVDDLGPGEVGFLTATIKDVADARVGDTITEAGKPCDEALPGFQHAKPMVFAGIFPTDSGPLRRSARRARQAAPERRLVQPRARDVGGARVRLSLRLSRACCTWRSSRSGWSASTTSTSSPRRPPCASTSSCSDGDVIELDNPAKFPAEGDIERIEEPIIGATIHTPPEYVGGRAQAVRGAARHADRPHYAGETPRDHPLRPAADRGGLRLLRPAEVRLARLRVARLRAQGLPGRGSRAPGPAGQRRSGRLAVGSSFTARPRTSRAATSA